MPHRETRRRPLLLALALLAACSGPQRPPPVAHTGWTLRYTQRVGEGASIPRDVQPDVRFAVLDGVAHIEVPEHQLDARLDRPRHAATLRGVPAPYANALAVSTATQGSASATGAAESGTDVAALEDGTEVAGVPTQGARFTDVVRTAAGTVRVTLEARWIDAPGDASVEVVKDWFVAPLEHLGARALVAAVRARCGLPLLWQVRLVNTRNDGSVAEGAVAILAAELGNAPEAPP